MPWSQSELWETEKINVHVCKQLIFIVLMDQVNRICFEFFVNEGFFFLVIIYLILITCMFDFELKSSGEVRCSSFLEDQVVTETMYVLFPLLLHLQPNCKTHNWKSWSLLFVVCPVFPEGVGEKLQFCCQNWS